MLGRKNYTRREIERSRAMIDADLIAYRNLPSSAKTRELEVAFFNREVQILDYQFVHRLRMIEGKDGNPLVEVRVLCNSILLNDCKVQIERLPDWPESAGSSLKLPPDKSVLGFRSGDEIRLTEDQFVRLAEAFFAELEKRYSLSNRTHLPTPRAKARPRHQVAIW